MKDLTGCISRFIEDTRDEDGAQNFVWLPERGVMIHIDTCTNLTLVNAAEERLATEIAQVNAQLKKLRLIKRELG